MRRVYGHKAVVGRIYACVCEQSAVVAYVCNVYYLFLRRLNSDESGFGT